MEHDTCECCDVGCGACVGRCDKAHDVYLYRVDMDGGCYFCEDCAADAMESGLFSDEEYDTDLDDDDYANA